MDKKGFIMEIIIFMVVGIIAVIFFAAWMYGINLINSSLISVESDNPSQNISDISQQTFSYYNSGVNYLKSMAFILMFSYILASFIIAWLSPKYPIMFILYILLTAILYIFAVYISNTYENLMTNEALGSTLSEFTGANHIILHLGFYIILIAVICSIISISGIYLRRNIYGI